MLLGIATLYELCQASVLKTVKDLTLLQPLLPQRILFQLMSTRT